MNPSKSQLPSVASVTEARFARRFGSLRADLKHRPRDTGKDRRQHEDEAIALGNSWRESGN